MSAATTPLAFGRYELIYLLAQGGMGEVHLAKLTGVAGFEKLSIVKTILPHMSADPQFVERFHHEARVLVQLAHSNIAQVYDMGQVEKTFYMAMEYVAGVDLSRVQGRARELGNAVPISIAMLVGQKVAEALGYAHRKSGPDGAPLGIVHRDVSPQNVMVSYEGEVKVIDFGLAKSAARSKHTQPSTVLGKLGYMSPEQARAERVDHRSDIYSCGVVLWELLAGRPLFNGETVGEMVAAMANPRIPPLSSIRPEVSEALERVVRRALEPDPAERYSRADDFARSLNEQAVREGLSAGSEEVGNYVRAICPEEYAEQRKLVSRLSSIRRAAEQAGAPAGFEGTAIRGAEASGTAIRASAGSEGEPAAPPAWAKRTAAETPRAPVEEVAPRTAAPRRSALPFVLMGLAVLGGAAIVAQLFREGPPVAAPAPAPAAGVGPRAAAPAPPPALQKKEEAEGAPPPPSERVEAKQVVEAFVDRGQVYVRAGTSSGVRLGQRLPVVGPELADGKRALWGNGSVMEVWDNLARVSLSSGPPPAGEPLFGALEPKAAKPPARPPRRPAAAPLADAAPAPTEATPPRPAPAPPPEPTPAPKPAVAEPLKGRVKTTGFGPLRRLALFNESDVKWTRCELALPNELRYFLEGLGPHESEGILLAKFRVKVKPETEAELDAVAVSCVEGSARFPMTR